MLIGGIKVGLSPTCLAVEDLCRFDGLASVFGVMIDLVLAPFSSGAAGTGSPNILSVDMSLIRWSG